jgi:hypothetical protein
MKTAIVWLALALSLVPASGCSAEPPPPPRPPIDVRKPPRVDGPHQPIDSYGNGGIEGTDPRRAALVRGQPEADGLAAYGYVIFPEKPGQSAGEDRTRALNLCKAYQVHLAPVEGAFSALTFVTYWPVLDERVDLDGGCDQAVDAYDDRRLDWLRTCLKLEGKRGPVLVAQTVPYQPATPAVERIVLDLSGVDTPDLAHSIDQWKRLTVDKPGVGYNALNAIATFIARGSFRAAQYERLAKGCR